MNKKITSIIALAAWIVAVWLLLPFDDSFNKPQLSAFKGIADVVGMGVFVNLYRSYIKPIQTFNKNK